jgi:hypothetical protein
VGGRTSRETVTVIDASRVAEGARAVLGQVSVGAFPREVHATIDGRTVLVANTNSNTLALIDVSRRPWLAK